MEHTLLKPLTSNKRLLKISALVIGFLCWSKLNMFHSYERVVVVPLVCQQSATATFTAPATLKITLRGAKKALLSLDTDHLVAYITTEHMEEGQNGIVLDTTHLFLPESITVVHYIPSPLYVYKHEKLEECKEFYEQPQSNS